MNAVDPSLSQQLYQDARAKEVTAESAAETFEGYMVEMMVREMRKTVPEGLLSSSAMEMFSGMLDQELSKRIAAGGGLGMGSFIDGAASRTERAPRPAGGKRRQPGHLQGRLPVQGRITSNFGYRRDPFHGAGRQHKGMDIAAPAGTPIRPIRGGEVVFAGRRGGFGNAVIIDHGGGYRSIYAHCERLDVQEGQRVGPADVIGAVGSTGRSTGPHLHLEVHRDGVAVDPAEVLGVGR